MSETTSHNPADLGQQAAENYQAYTEAHANANNPELIAGLEQRLRVAEKMGSVLREIMIEEFPGSENMSRGQMLSESRSAASKEILGDLDAKRMDSAAKAMSARIHLSQVEGRPDVLVRKGAQLYADNKDALFDIAVADAKDAGVDITTEKGIEDDHLAKWDEDIMKNARRDSGKDIERYGKFKAANEELDQLAELSGLNRSNELSRKRQDGTISEEESDELAQNSGKVDQWFNDHPEENERWKELNVIVSQIEDDARRDESAARHEAQAHIEAKEAGVNIQK